MRRILLWMKYATYPLLAISVLLLSGFTFMGAFIAEFDVENRTEKTIVVTPIGAFGPEGTRAALPVKMFSFPIPPISALQAGDFRLAPGESVTIRYDMDDINFSEIMVFVAPDRRLQLTVDPNPTVGQYHSPLQKLYIIDDLSQLLPATPEVEAAAKHADGHWVLTASELGLLIGPWLLYALIAGALRLTESRKPAFAAA